MIRGMITHQPYTITHGGHLNRPGSRSSVLAFVTAFQTSAYLDSGTIHTVIVCNLFATGVSIAVSSRGAASGLSSLTLEENIREGPPLLLLKLCTNPPDALRMVALVIQKLALRR
jgi:hypothetical protein